MTVSGGIGSVIVMLRLICLTLPPPPQANTLGVSAPSTTIGRGDLLLLPKRERSSNNGSRRPVFAAAGGEQTHRGLTEPTDAARDRDSRLPLRGGTATVTQAPLC